MIECDSFRPQGAADPSNNPLPSPGPTVPFSHLPPLVLALYKHLLSAYYASGGPDVGRKPGTLRLTLLLTLAVLPTKGPHADLLRHPPPLARTHTCQASTAAALRVQNEKLKSTGWRREG